MSVTPSRKSFLIHSSEKVSKSNVDFDLSAFCCAKPLKAALVCRVLKRPHEQECEPAESAGAKRSRREFESLPGLKPTPVPPRTKIYW